MQNVAFLIMILLDARNSYTLQLIIFLVLNHMIQLSLGADIYDCYWQLFHYYMGALV